MSSDRRMTGVLCVTAWMAVGVLVLNATAGASTTTTATTTASPAAVDPPRPQAKPVAFGPDGRPSALAVDPPDRTVPDRAHHPLTLQVQGYGIDGTPLVTSTTPTGYSPKTVQGYLGLTGTGTGTTIAIVAAYNDPTITSDLATFDSTYGLAAPPSFKKVNQTGGTASFPVTDPNWSLEISLDVEWAHALAPAAAILLVEANSSSMNDLNVSIDYAAKQSAVVVISNSWGTTGGEVSGETVYDSHCKVTTKLCVFSTGDTGNPGGYPAYSPYVLAVGGTTLNLATSSTGAVSVSGETAWSGSGGGVSIYESRPSYQAKVNPTTYRSIPDVSYGADPATGFAVYDSTPYNGASGWFQMGGTSAGAPQWSAIVAVADQLRKAKKKAVLTAWNATSATDPTGTIFYALTSGLADVTTGPTNGACGAPCTPGIGYDDVTGLGSPRNGIDTALAAA